MQSRKICGFSGIVFSRMGVKESGLFSGRQTIWNALRVALGINSRKIILDFANPAGLRPRRICFFTGEGVTGSGIGCCWPAAKAQQIKCLLRQRSPPGSWRAATEGPFKSAEAENTVKRSSRRTGVNLQYFRVEPTSLGSERGEQPLFCNDDDRCLRQKQGGVVGTVASRMQGPLKGRSIRWEPQPVQGRGVSRGREGGVETPLSPSGPAERPRRRCRLQKPSGLPHAIALCMRNITKKHPPCGCTAGALKGFAGVLSGWCPCPQPGRRRSSQRPPRPSPGRGRSGAGPCWGCPGAC